MKYVLDGSSETMEADRIFRTSQPNQPQIRMHRGKFTYVDGSPVLAAEHLDIVPPQYCDEAKKQYAKLFKAKEKIGAGA